MRQPNLTQYSLPKQLLSKSLLCPRFFPFKSPENRRCCLHGQNMTCNPMARHLDHVFACLTSALTFLQPFPYFSQLVPIVFPKYFPYFTLGSFPDHSHIFPRSFPVLSTPHHSCLSMCFQTYSHGFPNCPKASLVAVPLDVLDVNVGAVEGGFACGCCALDLAESSIYQEFTMPSLSDFSIATLRVLYTTCSYSSYTVHT